MRSFVINGKWDTHLQLRGACLKGKRLVGSPPCKEILITYFLAKIKQIYNCFLAKLVIVNMLYSWMLWDTFSLINSKDQTRWTMILNLVCIYVFCAVASICKVFLHSRNRPRNILSMQCIFIVFACMEWHTTLVRNFKPSCEEYISLQFLNN